MNNTIENSISLIGQTNNNLIQTMIKELNDLSEQVKNKDGLDISNKLFELYHKIEQIKKDTHNSNSINQQNKKLILNQVANIEESFIKANAIVPGSGSSADPRFEKIIFTELINPDNVIGSAQEFVKKTFDDLNKILKDLEEKSITPTSALVLSIDKINKDIIELTKINNVILLKITEIKKINKKYTEYINDSTNISSITLTENDFYSNDCINENNPEMITNSSDVTQLQGSVPEDNIVQKELDILTKSINNIQKISSVELGNPDFIANNPKILKLLGVNFLINCNGYADNIQAILISDNIDISILSALIS